MIRRLLWIDSSAAAVAGVSVLILHSWLSELHSLPKGLLVFIGAVNLCYAAFSGSLASRDVRPGRLIAVLIFGNAFWAVVCVGLAIAYWGGATLFGIGHLLGEAVFVGALAGLEWRWRDQLRTA